MDDPTLFTSGALFTLDFLKEGIRHSPEYAAVDLPAVKAALAKIAGGFPHASKPNEATTEKDFVWPVLAALGWTDFLTQQNLSGFGRLDVPDALLFIDPAAKAKANAFPDEAKRYGFGAAVLEAKRWGRALDRAEGRKGDDKDIYPEEQTCPASPKTNSTRSPRASISGPGKPWTSQHPPINYAQCCDDPLNPPPHCGHSAKLRNGVDASGISPPDSRESGSSGRLRTDA